MMDFTEWDSENDVEEERSWLTDVPTESVFMVADKVLRMQIEWLIENVHVSPQFRDVMKHLWFSYLTVSLPDVVGGVEDVMARNKRWFNILRVNDFSTLINCPLKHVHAIVQAWETMTVLSDGERDDSAVTSVLRTERSAPAYGRTLHKKRLRRYGAAAQTETRSSITASHIYNVPERLTMTRLPALLGLGLLICKETTLVSDLIRWTRCLQLPYIIPPLSDKFHKIYLSMSSKNEGGLPPYSAIEWQWGVLSKLLELKPEDMPRLPVLDVVERFLEELNLPRDIFAFVVAVVESLNELEYHVIFKAGASPADTRRRPLNVEAFVMACVIHSLRMIFGMDDVCETKVSRETKQLQLLMHGEVRLFNFEEWVVYIDYRRVQLYRHTMILSGATAENSISLVGHHSSTRPKKFTSRSDSDKPSKGCQAALQQLLFKTGEEQVLVLAPNHRPFRSHSEALEERYPRLRTNFALYSIVHLLAEKQLPQNEWRIHGCDFNTVKGCLGRISGAQEEAINYMFPLRAHTSRSLSKSARMDDVPSASMRWLIRVCAEMIELPPDSLLGEVLFLEMATFPNNPFCKHTGKGGIQVALMREGQ